MSNKLSVKLLGSAFVLSISLQSAVAAVIALPDSTGNGVGSSYEEQHSLSTTISDDAAVYLVATMTMATANTNGFDAVSFYAGATERFGAARRFVNNDAVLAGSITVTTGTEFEAGNPILFVLKVNQITNFGALYVNPNLSDLESNNIVDASATISGNNNYDNVRYRGSDSGNDVDYTNVAVYYGGDSPFSTIPEPSSLILLGTGLMSFLLRRRRRV